MRVYLTFLLILLFISCNNYSNETNRSFDYGNRSNEGYNREYEIDNRNGYKDLSFGDHIDSLKVKLSNSADFDGVEIEEKNIDSENKIIITVQNSYLNSLGDIKFGKIELHFYDSRLFEIRFDRSVGNSGLFYDTLTEVFGFRPIVETGWYRNKTPQEWFNEAASSLRTGEPYSNRVDLEARVWRGRKVSARLIGEKSVSTYNQDPAVILWSDLRLWNMELSKEAEKYVSETPLRTAQDF